MKTAKRFILPVILVLSLISSCDLGIDDPVDPEDPRDKFLGEWKVNEDCLRMNYSVEITPDPGNSAQVLISNFGNPGPGYDPAVGLVTTNTIHVTSQTIGEGWTVSGKGTYQSDGSVLWDYSLLIGPTGMDCSAVYTR